MDGVTVTHPGEPVTVVALHGEHDCLTQDAFAALLTDEVARHELIVVDVSEAEFVDASVVHAFEQADAQASARGSRLVLQMGTAYIVRRVLEISGVLERLDVAHSRQEAVSPARPANRSEELPLA